MAEDVTVHKFLGDVRDPFPRPQDHVLCQAKTEDIWAPLDGVNVTLINDDVTCPACIEWLRA
jgi:hypothetical protein